MGRQRKTVLHTQPIKTFKIVTFSPHKLKTLIHVTILNVWLCVQNSFRLSTHHN